MRSAWIAVALAVGLAALALAPAAGAATLGSPVWSVSQSQTGATGVTYTYSFTTTTGASLSSVAMSVPGGTAGTAAVVSVSGLPSSGSVSKTGNTLTYALGATWVNPNTPVTIRIGGLTNTSSAGAYNAEITTNGTTGGPPAVPIDTGTTAPIAITAGTLGGSSWTSSKLATGATNAAYTYGFATATPATLTSVTMTVPPGTGGTPAVGAVSGLPPSGTVSLSGSTLTYAFPATSVSSSTAVSVQITGLTNTSSTGSYSSQLTTHSASGPIDTGFTAPVSFTGGSLSNSIWTTSKSGAGATNASYMYTFTTATGAALQSVSIGVPPGTGGTPTLGAVSGLPGSGSVSLSGGVLTYSGFGSGWINGGTAVSIQVDGLTNTSTIGSYTSQITTNGSTVGGPAIPIDTGSTAAVAITGGTLADPIWSLSGFGAGATGVTYTYTFTTATAAALQSVTMTVPPGTGGTPSVGAVSGVPGGGTASLAGGQLTYSFGSTSVAAGTAISIQVTGVTNTSSIGSYTSQITTHNAGGPVDTGLSASVSITGGSLVNPIWTTSKSGAGATGAAYTYTFTTATGAALTKVTMTVPPGTGGTPAVGSVSGVAAGGSVSLAGSTLTYTIPGGTWVNAGTAVSIQLTGLTNTATLGSYTSQLTTHGITGGPPATPIDTGASAAVAITGGVLANAIWTTSKTGAGATATTYGYTFTTATAGPLSKVTMTVPPGTAGTPAVGAVSGIPGSGTASLAGNTLTYAFASTNVPSGTAVSIQVTGVTNTPLIASYTSQLTTHNGTTPVDTATTAPVDITGGTLINPIWTSTKAAAGATNAAYTYTFTTATGAALTKVTMTVPPGTAGAPAVGAVSGVAGGGSASLAGNTLTYTIPGSTWVNAGTAVSIQLTGLTNTSTSGSYTSQLTTHGTTGGPPATPIDTGTSAPVSVTGGALGSPIWTSSKLAAGATGATYRYTFTTATTSPLTKVTMTVPPATGGSPAAGAVSGIPGSGTVSLAGNTLTYAFPSTSVADGTAVSLEITGVTNTSLIASYTSQVTTHNGTTPVDTGVSSAVAITSGALVNPTWSVSKSGTGATGVAYDYAFTTATGAALSSLTMSVPPGTGGSPAVGAVTGVSGAGSVSLAGNTLTYTIPGSTWVNAGTAVSVRIAGLTNTPTAGTYSAQLATNGTTGGPPPIPLDTGLTPAVPVTPGNAAVAYVANSGGGSVTPLTAGAPTAGPAISTAAAPRAVALAPDASTAYVTHTTGNTLTRIAVATGTVAGTTALTGCTTPEAVAVTPAGTRAYVACSGNARVVPVTLPAGTVGSAIAVGTAPSAVAVAPNGTTAYVLDRGANTMTPIDVATDAAAAPVTLTGCASPDALAITPDGTTAFVACSGNATVLPVTLATGLAGPGVAVGTTPRAVAITPDGTKALVASAGSNTVTPIAVASRTAGAAIAVGASPRGIAITPDGAAAYVTNGGAASVTPIAVASGTPGTAIAVGATPVGIALTPDQAPVAALSVTPGEPGGPTHFDASASAVAYGTIASYEWDFGDGTTTTTTAPTVSHVYAAGCEYEVTLKLTSSAGTSTTRVFSGQTMSRNGGASAQLGRDVAVTRPLGFATPPQDVGFSQTLDGDATTAVSALDLDVGSGTSAAGWSISATSTTFSTGGAEPVTLADDAVTIDAEPAVACDGDAECVPAESTVAYPYTLPAGPTAPTATKLFDAQPGTGVCDQTVTPTFTVSVPAGASAGTYASTWTVTLATGP